MAMGEAEDLEQRLDDQINWYGKKSAANQTAFKRRRLIEIIAAAAIPLLAGYSQTSGYVGMTIDVMGMFVAVLAGIVSLYRFQENWNEYRAVCYFEAVTAKAWYEAQGSRRLVCSLQ